MVGTGKVEGREKGGCDGCFVVFCGAGQRPSGCCSVGGRGLAWAVVLLGMGKCQASFFCARVVPTKASTLADPGIPGPTLTLLGPVPLALPFCPSALLALSLPLRLFCAPSLDDIFFEQGGERAGDGF